MLIDLEDQEEMVKQEALVNGMPHVRYIHASRTLPGPEDVDRILAQIIDGLLRPLSEEEKQEGMHSTDQSRVILEGTYDQAEEFFSKTRYVPRPLYAPISVYTDGLPVRLPTEERVKEMLKGTSHRPDEMITYKSDRIVGFGGEVKKGELVRFQPMKWTATVEKVATIAVMAGCKPEYLPIVLAIAESGVPTGTTVYNNQWCCVSGPIVKEIGMNADCGSCASRHAASVRAVYRGRYKACSRSKAPGTMRGQHCQRPEAGTPDFSAYPSCRSILMVCIMPKYLPVRKRAGARRAWPKVFRRPMRFPRPHAILADA